MKPTTVYENQRLCARRNGESEGGVMLVWGGVGGVRGGGEIT